jgi:pimeloyl-ACP methyl ester carboxylesterase
MSAAATPAQHVHRDFGADGEGWVRPGGERPAVVFVHGFTGHFHDTWTWRPPLWKRLWDKTAVNVGRDLLAKDDTLDCDYYSFGHTAANFDTAAIEDLATALRTFLNNTVAGQSLSRRVVLVAHSLGGVLCRHTIVDLLQPGVPRRCRIAGLLMMGVPNLGTDIARLAPSRSARDIEPWENFLERLNREWLRHIVNGGDPDLEPEQRTRLKCGVVYGLKDRIVPAASAKAMVYLGELHAVTKGHIELPKCESRDDTTYGVLRQFILDALKNNERASLEHAATALSFRSRRRILPAPPDEHEWTVREQELIELTPRAGAPAGTLNCRIRSVRSGREPRPEVVVSVSLEGSLPGGIQLDYGYLFGRGMLSDAEYSALGDNLSNATLSQAEFDKLLRVTAKLTDAAGADIGLNAPLLECGPGYALLRYRLLAGEQPRLAGHSSRLELTIETTVERRQGWYGFRSTRTILEELELQLIAPFPVYAAGGFWWCAAARSEERLGARRYSSKVTIPGPVPVGTGVIWFFDPQT